MSVVVLSANERLDRQRKGTISDSRAGLPRAQPPNHTYPETGFRHQPQAGRMPGHANAGQAHAAIHYFIIPVFQSVSKIDRLVVGPFDTSSRSFTGCRHKLP